MATPAQQHSRSRHNWQQRRSVGFAAQRGCTFISKQTHGGGLAFDSSDTEWIRLRRMVKCTLRNRRRDIIIPDESDFESYMYCADHYIQLLSADRDSKSSREQIEIEHVVRRRYEDKWGCTLRNSELTALYDPNHVNARVQSSSAGN